MFFAFLKEVLKFISLNYVSFYLTFMIPFVLAWNLALYIITTARLEAVWIPSFKNP